MKKCITLDRNTDHVRLSLTTDRDDDICVPVDPRSWRAAESLCEELLNYLNTPVVLMREDDDTRRTIAEWGG